MPQFVILRHTLPAHAARSSHFDLLLEDQGQLLTWALAELPSDQSQTAEQLAPHRLDYLTYEGPVSNDRGTVRRVVAGTFDWLQREPHEWIVELHSPQLTGELRLIPQDGPLWIIRFQRSTAR